MIDLRAAGRPKRGIAGQGKVVSETAAYLLASNGEVVHKWSAPFREVVWAFHNPAIVEKEGKSYVATTVSGRRYGADELDFIR